MIVDKTIDAHLTSLLVSLLLGSFIGAEREYKGRNIGFRTIILITVGSSLFTILSATFSGDASRIAANIVTGIGFFGAGAIFREGGTVKGVTTASIIWTSAAVGMACGIGQYELAVVVTIIILIVSVGFVGLQKVIDKYSRERLYVLTYHRNGDKEEKVKELVKKNVLKGSLIRQYANAAEITLEFEVRGREENHHRFLQQLCADADLIKYVV
jgi:putative Mg2+ transporter-C (MgtC) family protein